ncbi:MAG: hypothetical protein R3B06_07345 [Kofleriaceae bacterium]
MVTLAACGGADAPAVVDAGPARDGAGATDAAPLTDATLATDAPQGPDADVRGEPTLAEEPCGASAPAVTIEYYSCGFFIGGGDLRIDDVVQFIGCPGHAVRAGSGRTLTEAYEPRCYRATTAGTLTYACAQHPANAGSVVVTP